MKRNVAILVFDEVEVLDFAGPYEVFAAADKRHGGDAFNVCSLHVVRRLLGAEAADETARHMEYRQS
ncbi:MAG: hypothetical protein Q7S40_19225 [Opitutaceae bacterium]|nr:hypothetical protein [Opitutaceae bacterium]